MDKPHEVYIMFEFLLSSLTLLPGCPLRLSRLFKDVRAKTFHSIDFFFKLLLRTDNELLASEIKIKNWGEKLGVTDFVSEIKRVEN